MARTKQYIHTILICAGLIFYYGAYGLTNQQNNDNKAVIKITAKRFEYSPPVVELKKGVPVTLELTALDRIHGFNVPGLGLRADVPPGQTVHVDLLPDKAGQYIFLCDIFCGNGHGEMNGVIVVKD